MSYSKSKLDYRSESDLEGAVRTPEAERFIRRKAVLTQLSNVVDVLEKRLYFNDVKGLRGPLLGEEPQGRLHGIGCRPVGCPGGIQLEIVDGP